MKTLLALLALATALAFSTAAKADPFLFGNVKVIGSDDIWVVGESVTFADQSAAVYAIGDGILSPKQPTDSLTLTSGISLTNPDELLFTLSNGLSFTLTSPITITQDDAGTLSFNGWGYYSETGYEDTPASLHFTTTNDGGTGFTIATSARSPEPGSLLLFGTGLFGLAFVAFRKSGAAFNL